MEKLLLKDEDILIRIGKLEEKNIILDFVNVMPHFVRSTE